MLENMFGCESEQELILKMTVSWKTFLAFLEPWNQWLTSVVIAVYQFQQLTQSGGNISHDPMWGKNPELRKSL